MSCYGNSPSAEPARRDRRPRREPPRRATRDRRARRPRHPTQAARVDRMARCVLVAPRHARCPRDAADDAVHHRAGPGLRRTRQRSTACWGTRATTCPRRLARADDRRRLRPEGRRLALLVRRWQLNFMASETRWRSRHASSEGYLVGPYAWHLAKNTRDKLWTVQGAVGMGYTGGLSSVLSRLTETADDHLHLRLAPLHLARHDRRGRDRLLRGRRAASCSG